MPPRKRAYRRPGCHIEWEFINGPVFTALRSTESLLYLTLWSVATHDRRNFVCRMRWPDTYLAHLTGLDLRTLRNTLTRVQHGSNKNAVLGTLIEVTDHYIKVNGVKEKQDWMEWKGPRPCCADLIAYVDVDIDKDGDVVKPPAPIAKSTKNREEEIEETARGLFGEKMPPDKIELWLRACSGARDFKAAREALLQFANWYAEHEANTGRKGPPQPGGFTRWLKEQGGWSQ